MDTEFKTKLDFATGDGQHIAKLLHGCLQAHLLLIIAIKQASFSDNGG